MRRGRKGKHLAMKGTPVDPRTGKMRYRGGKQKRQNQKSERPKLRLTDLLDQLFEVTSEVPDLKKPFYIDQ